MAWAAPGAEIGYVDSAVCSTCHGAIAESYARTGMGRSFFRPAAGNTVEDYSGKNTYYHAPSESYFTMARRDGAFYQGRYQLDRAGRRVNAAEKRVDYVLGSGNHVRSYLSRAAGGTLVELPLAWYAEKGGYWGMNPGYDRANHDGFRRTITYDCMFCHNAYPSIPAAGAQPLAMPVYQSEMPEGIDCQRCHGPGAAHVASGGKAAIVNPAKLSLERQMDVCMQCHLETTSFPLPNAIQKYERGPFSYRPGEALGKFLQFFDHAAGTGKDDKFEIVSAAYRLRKSACFLRSEEKLTCTTCHNPHDIPRGEAAVKHYDAACRTCHAGELKAHVKVENCAGCHMPKRRTEDVVHAAVTDHLIQRRLPVGDLLAERLERHEANGDYQGEVVPYLTAANALYAAVAQVIQGSNVKAGIGRLTEALAANPGARGEYYFQLAEALRGDGQLVKSLPGYREAVRRNPGFGFGWLKLGFALRRAGRLPEAVEALRRGVAVEPGNAAMRQELGLALGAQGKRTEAMAAMEKAVALNPDLSEGFNNLGVMRSSAGDLAGAEAAFREAVRLQPDLVDARANLGGLLAERDFGEAKWHFEAALRVKPNDARTRYGYAMALGRARDFEQAQRQLEAAVGADGEFAEAHQLLGDLLLAKGEARGAVAEYREALRIRPGAGRARLGLAGALMGVGDRDGAVAELRKAAGDADSGVRGEALKSLRGLGIKP